MKKKLLICLASIGALVGAGFATWSVTATIGDGAYEEVNVPVSFDTDLEVVKLSDIQVTPDAGNSDVIIDVKYNTPTTLKYNVKAVTSKIGTGEEDAYSIYGNPNCTETEVPVLKVTMEPLFAEGQAEPAADQTKAAALAEFIALPNDLEVLPYEGEGAGWLEDKDNGYTAQLQVKWAAPYNVEDSSFMEVLSKSEITPAEYKAEHAKLEAAVKDLKSFAVHFTVTATAVNAE